ncbi:MAG: glutamate racemase [Oscillospiraceae bacterium]|nr:glutamate racemase [Oscillospiraceae bacterium]
MEKKSIGVFDSGLGGLTAVKQLLKVLPNENIVYFGDTGRVPYGNRSNNTIKKYALQDAKFLLSHNVKLVIAACGTVSSVAGDLHSSIGVPYTGVVNPTVYTAIRTTKNNRIGVIGTSATIASHSYKTRIKEENPNIKVFEQDCPLFVPLVENGFIDKNDPIVRLTVERYLNILKENDIDTLILGCTHYPILKDAIGDVMGNGVTLIDSGMETAYYTKKILKRENLLAEDNQQGQCQFFVSDTPDNFEKVAEIFLGRNMEHSATQINIEKY